MFFFILGMIEPSHLHFFLSEVSNILPYAMFLSQASEEIVFTDNLYILG